MRMLNSVLAVFFLCIAAHCEEQPAIVTFYSPPGGGWTHYVIGAGGEKAWAASKLFDGEQRIVDKRGIFHDRFLTLKMKSGEHDIAGDEPWHFNVSKYKNKLAFESGNRYFVRLTMTHSGYGAIGKVRWLAAIVPCEQAIREAAKATPVPTKKIDRAVIRDVVREMYFPTSCEQTKPPAIITEYPD